tara:strand:- start:806 stop:1069 length:264 start_codon:yes stop_codon:yes gene_type:complete
MKIFIYKTLIVFLFIFLCYKLTIGYTISKFEQKFYSLGNKENVEQIKNKIRNELQEGVEKDRILDKDDAILIKKFIDKINKDLNNLN